MLLMLLMLVLVLLLLLLASMLLSVAFKCMPGGVPETFYFENYALLLRPR